MAGRAPIVSYEADVKNVSGSVIDGDVRPIKQVSVVRYDTPTSKPVKVGSRMVKAWLRASMDREVQRAIADIIERDKYQVTQDIQRKIERIQNANRVNLRK